MVFLQRPAVATQKKKSKKMIVKHNIEMFILFSFVRPFTLNLTKHIS